MQYLPLQFCNPLPIFWRRVREGENNENEIENEYGVNCQFVIRNYLYNKQIVARNPFPSFGGVPEGRGGSQNENEIENEYGVNCQLSIVNC
jgi:hypothetical protein